jgi:hypothetical protein
MLSPYTSSYVEQQEGWGVLPYLNTYEQVMPPTQTQSQAATGLITTTAVMPNAATETMVVLSTPQQIIDPTYDARMKRNRLFWGLGIAAAAVAAIGVGWAVAK